MQGLLPAAVPPLQTSRATSELPTLRKRQSFNFVDNRLGPAMLTRQPQAATQLPAQSGVVLSTVVNAASKAGCCAASAAASLPASSLAAARIQSAETDITCGTTPSGQSHLNLSMPSMPDGKSQHMAPVAVAVAAAEAAEKSELPFTDSCSSPAVVAGSAPGRKESEDTQSRAAARAGSASAPVAASKTGHNHTAVKSFKTAVPPKPGWQH